MLGHELGLHERVCWSAANDGLGSKLSLIRQLPRPAELLLKVVGIRNQRLQRARGDAGYCKPLGAISRAR